MSLSDLELLNTFGDGSDGDLTISSGTVTLARDMFYNNLTIDGTGSLDPNGFQIRGIGVLDLTNAPAGAIKRAKRNGGNAAGPVAGAGATASATASAGGSGSGLPGKAGGVNAGVASTASVVGLNAIGGLPGASAQAGTGAVGAGGLGIGKPVRPAANAARALTVDTYAQAADGKIAYGGIGAPGGPSGSGDGAGAGGGGGGGGTGGGVLDVRFRTIARGAGTAAGAIQAPGGDGGNGGVPVGGNRGGGSGAPGAGGGLVYLVYETLLGATAVGCIDVSGGDAGDGAAGTGTGTAGQGGHGGDGGRLRAFDLGAMSVTDSLSLITGAANSGMTGGTGAVQQYDL